MHGETVKSDDAVCHMYKMTHLKGNSVCLN